MLKFRLLLLPLFIIAVILSSMFFFFKPMIESKSGSEFSMQILSAMLGTILTISITALLLKAQSASEENKEKSLGIFQHKLKTYNSFIECLWHSIEDGKITTAEVMKMSQWAASISLIAKKETSISVVKFINQCKMFGKFSEIDLDDKETQAWKNYVLHDGKEDNNHTRWVEVGHLIQLFRKDLGEDNLSEHSDLVNSGASLNNLVFDIRKKQRAKELENGERESWPGFTCKLQVNRRAEIATSSQRISAS